MAILGLVIANVSFMAVCSNSLSSPLSSKAPIRDLLLLAKNGRSPVTGKETLISDRLESTFD